MKTSDRFISRQSWERRFRICAWIETSRADTGSSAMMIFGLSASARAIAIRWRWPPENSWGYFRAKRGASPTTRMSSSTWARTPEGPDRSRGPAAARRASRGPSSSGSARRRGPGRSSAGRAGRRASRPATPRQGCGRSGPRRPRSSGRAGGSCGRASTCRSRTRPRGRAPRPGARESVTPSTARTVPNVLLDEETRVDREVGPHVPEFEDVPRRILRGARHATLISPARARMQACAWPGADSSSSGRAAVALVQDEPAARGEGAAGHRLGDVRRQARDGVQFLRPSAAGRGSSAAGPACTGASVSGRGRAYPAVSMIRPAYMTCTRSQSPDTTPRSWVTKMTAIPSSRCILRDQLQDLRLHGHVEGRRGLVGDQELRAG
jgi:hypothetical protein